MLIGEAERFPELARAWYASGPERSVTEFAGWFAAWDRRGLLWAPDPVLAGRQFNWLVLSIPLKKAMAYATDEPLLTTAELDHYADEAVRCSWPPMASRAPAADVDQAVGPGSAYASSGVVTAIRRRPSASVTTW